MSLVESKNFRKLKYLSLAKNNIQLPKGPFSDLSKASEVFVTRYMMRLEYLDLSKNPLQQKHRFQKPFFRNTIVIAFPEQKAIYMNKEKQDKLEAEIMSVENQKLKECWATSHPESVSKKFQTNVLLKPTEEQRKFIENT